MRTPTAPTDTVESIAPGQEESRPDGATIRSIMRDPDLQAAQPRVKATTTIPAEDLAERPDLEGRDFAAEAPKGCGLCDGR